MKKLNIEKVDEIAARAEGQHMEKVNKASQIVETAEEKRSL